MTTSFALLPSSSLLLVVDVQERFTSAIPAIAAEATVGNRLRILAEGCRLLGVQALISEQYPQGLGPTLPWLAGCLPEAPRLAKSAFSCWDDEGLRAAIVARHASEVIICGIEAHVCVLATVADLLAAGTRVIVAADAVASRHDANCGYALAAMRDLGALVLPVESILFRLQRRAGTSTFKALSALVR